MSANTRTNSTQGSAASASVAPEPDLNIEVPDPDLSMEVQGTIGRAVVEAESTYHEEARRVAHTMRQRRGRSRDTSSSTAGSLPEHLGEAEAERACATCGHRIYGALIKQSGQNHHFACIDQSRPWEEEQTLEEIDWLRRLRLRHADDTVAQIVDTLRTFQPDITKSDLSEQVHGIVHSESVIGGRIYLGQEGWTRVGDCVKSALRERVPRDRAAWLAEDIERHLVAMRNGPSLWHNLRMRMAQALAEGSEARTLALYALCGAALCGAVGGVTGLAFGASIGAAVGAMFAVFTLGLSIVAGAVIGATVGSCIGVAFGATVGLCIGMALYWAMCVFNARPKVQGSTQPSVAKALARALRSAATEIEMEADD